MTGDRPWVRGELPWIRSGPLFRIHREAVPALDAFLQRWSYQRVDLDGRRMVSRIGAHTELSRAFGFPGYYGKNWDAFNDCFGDYVIENSGARIAIVWTGIDAAAMAAPATTAEVGWALLEASHSYQPAVDPTAGSSVSLDVFVIGTGPDFDRPA
ncbi:barstar family protein [Micromonospora sp. NBC_00898]|uniref:barstar family protein n=1 Tax=Micromonospora sp. NBC_00898 TaxID=2975981 RepID=UPI0038669A81|nr:barstar family protein [Micromonospora sp. NBC_00898]